MRHVFGPTEAEFQRVVTELGDEKQVIFAMVVNSKTKLDGLGMWSFIDDFKKAWLFKKGEREIVLTCK